MSADGDVFNVSDRLRRAVGFLRARQPLYRRAGGAGGRRALQPVILQPFLQLGFVVYRHTLLQSQYVALRQQAGVDLVIQRQRPGAVAGVQRQMPAAVF